MFVNERLVLGNVKLYEEFGIFLIRTSGEETSPFGITQKILEDKPPFSDNLMFQYVEREPLQFTLKFAKEGDWTPDQRMKFAKLLYKREYQTLMSVDYPYLLYRVICVDTSEKTLFSSQQGYMTITFRCDTWHGWSPKTLQTYRLMENPTSGTILKLENKSNINEIEYPIVEIFSVQDNNSISIKNLSDGQRGFTISKLEKNEIVNIDNKYGDVITNVPNVYRYNDLNGKWLRLKYGLNNVEVKGKCILTVVTQVAVAL